MIRLHVQNSFLRRLALIGLGLAVACSDATGPGRYEGVRVMSDIQDGVVSTTIRNESSITITYHPRCDGGLQHREGRDWKYTYDIEHICLLDIIVTEIRPGEEHLMDVWNTASVEAREYRFNVDLRGPDGKSLPGVTRISNSFRIE